MRWITAGNKAKLARRWPGLQRGAETVGSGLPGPADDRIGLFHGGVGREGTLERNPLILPHQ